MIPDKIPMKALVLLEKAKATSSGLTPCNWATTSLDRIVVIIKKATKPLRPAAPFLSLAKPTAKPTANKSGILSIKTKPAWIKKTATGLVPVWPGTPKPAGLIQ